MMEPVEIARWKRNLAAMINAASTDDPETFATVAQLLNDAQAQLPAACQQMRQPASNGLPGYTWAEIAAPLGTTRQAAQMRYGSKEHTS
jgi:hypothetical protein